LKHDPHPEHRNSNACNGKETGAVVNPGIPVNGRENTKDDTEEDGEGNGNEDEFKGGRQKELDVFPDLMAGSDRPPEISPNQAFHIVDILNNEGLF
jgi:hypothetical protein